MRGFRTVSEESDDFPNVDEYFISAEGPARTALSWYLLGPAEYPPFAYLGDDYTCYISRTIWQHVGDDYCKARCILANRATLTSQWG